jgi:hypothetical protein
VTRDERIQKIIERVQSGIPDDELDDIETLFRSQDNLKDMKKWHEESKNRRAWKPDP